MEDAEAEKPRKAWTADLVDGPHLRRRSSLCNKTYYSAMRERSENAQDNDRSSKAKIGGYSFNVSTSELGKQAYMNNRQEPPKPLSPKRTVNGISGGEKVNSVTYTAAKKRVVNEIQADDKLVPKARTLSGFDNSSVVTKGEIILTTFAKGVIKDTKFQIKIDPVDEKKTSFITERGTYCYKVILFSLKNARATYQKLVTKMFQEYLGKTMEVYIEDMLVKSTQAGDHIQHLSDTFQILRKFNMKLNPEKCAFGMSSGKFLGFLVSNRGIEVNLAKIKAIEEIPDILTSKKKSGEIDR
uniref:Reverse transcriptase domain-containing protein n=1 Tax=Nicotiana tabacum TaxID=4097 RepID=A0A1S3YDZ6_TOBAC|nr:PREDICTED: uncharacterized protein LOC107775063 [Nicotiana tabacum]